MNSSPAVRRLGGFVLLALLCVGTAIQAKSKKPVVSKPLDKKPLQKEDIYLPSVLKWDRPAAAEVGDLSHAISHVNIAVFYPGGEFVGGNISVTRAPDGELIAQPKEDFSLRRGTWTRNGKDVTVQSTWVKYESSENAKKKKNKPIKETWFTDPKIDKTLSHYIVIGATEYVQAETLQNPETLQEMFTYN